MQLDKKFMLNSLSLSILSALAMPQAWAYQQGEGEIASVAAGEKVSAAADLSASQATAVVTGEINRSGNPVRVIWYGNANEKDGKIAQKGADNQGLIISSLTAKGADTAAGLWGNVIIEGQGNGIDVLGWSAHNNHDSVAYDLSQISNQRLIDSQVDLSGGKAETFGAVKSFATGNGISIVAAVDYGPGDPNAQTIDGMSGSTPSVIAAADTAPTGAIYREQRAAKTDESSTYDFLAKPKNAQVQVAALNNTGSIQASLHSSANAVTNQNDDFRAYAVKTVASGNAAALTTYVFTPRSGTWGFGEYAESSVNHHNTAQLERLDNSGMMSAQASLSGSQTPAFTHDIYTYTKAAGNGVSVAALSNNDMLNAYYVRAKGGAEHRAEARIDAVDNQGRIRGQLQQIANNNSTVENGAASIAEAFASGNGLSAYAESTSVRNQHTHAAIGKVNNLGEIAGAAHVVVEPDKATGDLSIETRGVGNGISAYSVKYLSKGSAEIGAIDNQGIIKGSISAKPGTSALAANHDIPEEEVKLFVADANTKNKYANHVPKNPPNSSAFSGTKTAYRADAEIFASGNGIVGFIGESANSDVRQGTTLGTIDNRGVISGYANLAHGFKSSGGVSSSGYQEVEFLLTGTGIAADRNITENITNMGLISGNHAAIITKGDAGFGKNNYSKSSYLAELQNYGLMAGTMIAGHYHKDKDGRNMITVANNAMRQPWQYYESSKEVLENFGTLIYLKQGLSVETVQETDARGRLKWVDKTIRHDDAQTIDRIVLGAGGKHNIAGTEYQIINGTLDASGKDSSFSASGDLSKSIINGAGIATGALAAHNDLQLNNVIVNGYKTGLYLGDGVTVNAQASLFNSNGFVVNRNQTPKAVLGSTGNNTLNLSGNSFVNGDMFFAAGDDKLWIADANVKINGRLIDMGDHDQGDTITFGTAGNSASTPIKVDYAIKNAENLLIDAPTRFTADARITGANLLTINDTLIYEVNGDKDHALYDDNRATPLNLNGKGKFSFDIADEDSELGNKVHFGGKGLSNNGVEFTTTRASKYAEMDSDGVVIFKDKPVTPQPPVNPTPQPPVNPTPQPPVNPTPQPPVNPTPQPPVNPAPQPPVNPTPQPPVNPAPQPPVNPAPQPPVNPTPQPPVNPTPQPPVNPAPQPPVNPAPQPPVNPTPQPPVNPTPQPPVNPAPQFNTFVSPYSDAYNSWLSSRTVAGNPNFLAASESLKDKNYAQANAAINAYLGAVVEHNIYGAVPQHAVLRLQHFRQHSLEGGKRLQAGEYLTKVGLATAREDFDNIAADHASTQLATAGLAYGINDQFTITANAGLSRDKLTGFQDSRLKGNSIYGSVAAITGVDNFTFTTGLAYAHSDLSGERYTGNGYDNHRFDADVKTNSFSLFGEAKYRLPLNEQFSLEPRAGLALNHVRINAQTENGAGALGLAKYSDNTLEASVGSNVVYTMPLAAGKLNAELGLDYVHTAGKAPMIATFKDGSNFALRTASQDNQLRIGAGLEYVSPTGLSLKTGLANSFGDGGKDLNAFFKIGFKF